MALPGEGFSEEVTAGLQGGDGCAWAFCPPHGSHHEAWVPLLVSWLRGLPSRRGSGVPTPPRPTTCHQHPQKRVGTPSVHDMQM